MTTMPFPDESNASAATSEFGEFVVKFA